MQSVKKWSSSFLALVMIFSLLLYVSPKQTAAAASTSNFTWDNANVYFVMTDRFYDGNSSNNNSYGRPSVDAKGSNIGTFHGGDVKGLTKKLQEGYFTNLGTNVIWLTAPYEQMHGWTGGGSGGDFAHYAYHGYYANDFTEMDKNMGTVDEMREFVDLAHSLGIRVVLDVVMNHAGYSTIKDMEQYGYGTRLNGMTSSWVPGSGQTWHSFNDNIDYNDATSWAKWWGAGWVRAGIAGYTPGGGDDLTQTLSGLPDFKTDVTTSQGLPPLLKTKWAQEGSSNNAWVVPAASGLRQDLGIAPADYIVKWLSSWVQEFGIDGFRCDTAKHVEQYRWKQLKDSTNAALQTWRANNPTKPGANWTDNFWMTGEVWGHGISKDSYYSNGFDSLINFSFQNSNLNDLEGLFSSYASQLNSDSDSSFNALSYISSHDTKLYDRNSLIQAGTALLLLPGGVQTYYGDESGRVFGATGSDSTQGTRSDMNWSSMNTDVLQHWQKLGQFRNNHPAVGAGTHKLLASSPYTFSRTYTNAAKGIDDRVVVATGASGSTSVTVSGVFGDGTLVRDAYTGATTTVSGGKAVFTAGSKGVILIEAAGPIQYDPSVSASPAGGKFTTDEVSVTLSTAYADTSTYTTDGSEPSATNGQTYTNGTIITLGSGLAVGESVTLKLWAVKDGKNATASYTFTKADPPAGLTIHFKKPSTWSDPQLYYYETTPTTTGPTWATSPAMTLESGSWYVYTIPAVDSARVIFKDASGHQTPAANQAGVLRTQESWFDGTSWYTQNPDDSTAPTAPTELQASAHTSSSVTLAWTAATDNVGVTGYNIYRDGVLVGTATGLSYTDSGLTGSTLYKYTVKAKDAAGNLSPASNEVSVTTDVETGNSVTVYYKPGYSTPYIHYRPEGGTWTTAPGVAMTAAEVSGYYKITVNIGSASRLEAVFNNGSGTWDNNGGSNYFFNPGTSTYFGSGVIIPGAPTTADQVTIKVKVPSTTTDSDSVYLAGSLNSWNAADPAYKLTKNTVDGTYSITLSLAPGTSIQYKITRGAWTSVETTSSGGDVTNRTYTTVSGNQAIGITVAKWKDK
ncbi:Alpha-amylase precursor [compost metagenome]